MYSRKRSSKTAQNISVLWLLILCLWLFLSCDDSGNTSSDASDESSVQTQGGGALIQDNAKVTDQFQRVWLEESVESISIKGRLGISIRPTSRSSFGSTELLISETSCPTVIKARLPLKERVSGTVLVSLDPASEPEPISAKTWLLSERLEGGVSSIIDENPFSSTQQLFTVSRSHSLVDGSLLPKPLSLYTEPSALPPYLFEELSENPFSLALPPISSIEDFKIQIWNDLDEHIPMGQAKVSLWSNHKLVSTEGETNALGTGLLSIWGELKEQASEPSFTLRVKPTEASRLPMLIKNLDLEDLEKGQVELSTPRLGEIREVSIDVEVGSDLDDEPSREVWRLEYYQSWSAEVESAQNSPIALDTRRAAGIWRESKAIIPGIPQTLELYPSRSVIFILPPTQSLERAQRVELEIFAENNTLRLGSLPKPLVRGQVRDLNERSVEAELIFTQLAWPWRDAQVLPLGVFRTQTDGQGGFSVAVDPGVYAVSYLPKGSFAPKVTLLSVPEVEGLLISPRLALLQPGTELSLLVSDGTSTRPLALDGRVGLSCLISSLDEVFAGSSLLERGVMTAPLLVGGTKRGEFSFRLHEESCPEWPSEIETELSNE